MVESLQWFSGNSWDQLGDVKFPDDYLSKPNMIRETGRKVHKEISVYREMG